MAGKRSWQNTIPRSILLWFWRMGILASVQSPPVIHGHTLWPQRSSVDLASVLMSTPAMPGAACRGKAELFDAAVGAGAEAQQAQRRCVAVCSGCPSIEVCRQWASGLPERERQALGVVGGIAPEVPAKRQPQPETVIAARSEPRRADTMAGMPREHQRRQIEAQRAARRAARVAAHKQAS